ncbi:MAG: hypothetical protein GY699_07420 [Desulfobacteraceae bacterium]|nr:hypothetical protein [Desulfobacteraceae bacterium]
MNRLQELIEILSDKEVQARTSSARINQKCKICGNLADTFHTPLAKVEYHLSIICEDCQNYYYRYEN